MYLATPSTAEIRDAMAAGRLGAVLTPDSWPLARADELGRFGCWATDNACFAQGDNFDSDRWITWLDRLRPWRSSCLFAVVPDVVGDAEATRARSLPWMRTIAAMGYRPAWVAQEGVTDHPPRWDLTGAVFMGGRTEAFKFGEGLACAMEAKRRGLWAHMGRVNSFRRLRSAALAGVDSVDGTFLAFAPDTNYPKLMGWLDWLDVHDPLPL